MPGRSTELIHAANANRLSIYSSNTAWPFAYVSFADSGTFGICPELAGRCRDQGATVGPGAAAGEARSVVGPLFISLGRGARLPPRVVGMPV
jgi:hypothetical protein